MKEYLKMGDVFAGKANHEQKTFYTLKSEGFKKGDEVFVNDVWACFNGHSDAAKYAAHAINSHDELVEMNKELIDIINRVIDTSKELEGKACTSSWTDGYKQCAIDTGSALSEMIDKYKAKGSSV